MTTTTTTAISIVFVVVMPTDYSCQASIAPNLQLPPASVMEAQREYMASVNKVNRAVLISHHKMEAESNAA
jgi:hypothetical protein